MKGYGGNPHVNLTRLTCPAYRYRRSLPSVRVCSLALASARPIVNLKTALAFAAEQGVCACTPYPACPNKQDVLTPWNPVFLSSAEKSSVKSTR
jgi:hypothetical protein